MNSLEGEPEGPEEPWDWQTSLDKHCLNKVAGEGGEGGIAAWNVEFVIFLLLHIVLGRRAWADQSVGSFLSRYIDRPQASPAHLCMRLQR